MAEDLTVDSAPTTVPSALPARRTSTTSRSSDEGLASDGEIFDELENEAEDFDWGGFREQRMEEMRAEAAKIQRMQDSLKGRYTEIKNEKELIMTASKEPYVIIHFFHRDFRRCKIMDRHLEVLASSHPETLIVRADVGNCPFLVNKCQMQVLPCILCFVGGDVKDLMVGFDGIATLPGKEDEFKTSALEARLKQSGVFPVPGAPLPNQQPVPSYNFTNTSFGRSGSSSKKGIRQGQRGRDSDSEDDR